MRIIPDSPCVACGSREESCCRTCRRLRTKYRRRHTDTFTYPTTFDRGRPASDPGEAACAEAEPTGRLAAPQPATATRRSPPPPPRPPSERRRAGRDPPMKGPLLIGNHTITAVSRDGPQRPRAAKPSRGNGPHTGRRRGQPCAPAHPDRPAPRAPASGPPSPFQQYPSWVRGGRVYGYGVLARRQKTIYADTERVHGASMRTWTESYRHRYILEARGKEGREEREQKDHNLS